MTEVGVTGEELGSGPSARFFRWWADRPGLQFAVLVLASAAALMGYVRPAIVREFLGLQPKEAGSALRLPGPPSPTASATPAPDVEPFRVGGGECVVVATSPSFFTAEGVAAMRQAVADLEALPQVASVLWIDNVPGLNLFGLPEAILPRATASARQMESARARALGNPLVNGQLIAPDGQTLVLHLRLDWFHVTSDEDCTTLLRETAASAAAKAGAPDIRFQVTGPVPLHLMTINSHLRDSLRYQLIGYGIMLAAALILFRGVSAVIIVAVAPAIGVFWTMGMLHYFELQDNPFNDIIVPVLISLVGLTDSVHLMAEIRNQRAAGWDVGHAARRGITRVGLACVLTSLTTAIGFVSLVWAHHEIVRQFGWCCVLGVACTLVSVLTVVPLGCRSPLGRSLHVGLGKSLVDAHLRRIGPLVAWILDHDRFVSRAAIVLTGLLTLVALRLTPDEKRYSGLSESGEAAQALRHLDRVLGGLEFGSVSVVWNDQPRDGELLEVLEEVDAQLAAEPLLGHPLGLKQLLAALPGDGPAAERITLLELLPPSLKRAFYLPERHSATIQFRIQDLGIARYGPVFERLEAAMTGIMARHPQFTLQLGGDAVWRWRHVYRILTDLSASLGTASLIIWIVITIAYRSLRLGLISIVPNLLPLAATGALLVATGQYLELSTVCVFTICVGIAVDDTIHFLTRYVEERSAGGSHREVIERAFTGVGSALLMTTIVLVAGFLTAVIGDARDARLFGIMGAMTLTTALLADVLLLPALISRFGVARES